MEKFKVDFYKKEDGTKPVGQFIRALDVKKQQKTPRSEIELAKSRRMDYHRRKEAGTYE